MTTQQLDVGLQEVLLAYFFLLYLEIGIDWNMLPCFQIFDKWTGRGQSVGQEILTFEHLGSEVHSDQLGKITSELPSNVLSHPRKRSFSMAAKLLEKSERTVDAQEFQTLLLFLSFSSNLSVSVFNLSDPRTQNIPRTNPRKHECFKSSNF